MSPVPNPRKFQLKEAHWWRRRSWSLLVLAVLLLGIGGLAFKAAFDVSEALPEVGRDARGEDPWTDPIGLEKAGAFAIAHLPDCAAGPIVRIALWDESSKPYWEVSGPPQPLTQFVVGVTPEGFTEEVKFRAPPRGAVLRLVVIRRVKGPAGVRYQESDLRSKRVVAMLPLTRFTVEGFQTADVCGQDEDGSVTTTTEVTN
jgi:hypothetical protein